MNATRDLASYKTISWGSIIAGIVTVLAVSMLLSTLGTGLGFSMLDPTSEHPTNGAGTTVAVWSAISVIISLLAGAFVAGRLAGASGLIHGFLVWGSSLIVATILGVCLVSSAVKVTGNILGSIASVSGSVISETGSLMGKGISGLGDTGKDLLNQFAIDTDLKPEKLQTGIADALKKSNIPSLQPEFMQQQLTGAKNDIAVAVKQMLNTPQNNDAIIQKLINKLKSRSDLLTQDINQDSLKKVLQDNTSMSNEEIDTAVKNIIDAREKTAQIVSQRLDDAKVKINQAKAQFDELKQQAAEQAAEASSALAHAALWSFIALLIGAVISAFGGLWGVKTAAKCHKA